MKHSVKWFAVFVPIVIMALWLAKVAHVKSEGSEIELKVQAYDPRDILSGHYLTYTVVYGPEPICKAIPNADQNSVCVCLTESKNTPSQSTWSGFCTSRPSHCQVFVRGNCSVTGRFTAGIERYYIPESQSKRFARVPDNSTIKIRVSESGEAQVTDFLIDGKSIH